jgi:hypothetical protein
MAELPTVPIIIGITGKRDLRGKSEAVRKAIGAAFDLLDKWLPTSRKILLSALAAGADTIAAEEAIERSWTTLAVLPLELDLYAQDFDTTEATTLRRLVADPRVKTLTLGALNDPRSGMPFSSDVLARAAGKSNPDRTDHYEQVGIFIAERCALLIAIMDADERPDRVGGTARIVQYRLRGAPDSDAARVIVRSRELSLRSELDHPPTGSVWLIDLKTVGEDPNPIRAVELWRPLHQLLVRLVTGKAAIDLVLGFLGISSVGAAETEIVEKLRWRRERDLVDHDRMLERTEAFNKSVSEERWQTKITARGAIPEGGDASSALRWLRHAYSTVQGRKKEWHSRTVYGLSALFVLAVIALEMHFEFGQPILWYLALFAAILVVYAAARWALLQQFVEDYRAISEALRIQLVWWDTGMVGREYCVDNYFLAGTSGSLAMVRTGVRQAIVAAQLDRSSPPPVPSAADDWIGGQIRYFDNNIRNRELRLSWSEDAIWFFFMASAGMAAVLFEPAARRLVPIGDWLIANSAIGVAVFVSLLILSRALSFRGKLARRRDVRLALIILGAMAALLWGMMSAMVLLRIGENFGVGHALVAAAAVVTASFAGAVRFLVERLGWEPELHSYREALETFRRARDQLARIGVPPPPGKRERIIFQLGRFALDENESWIRAHRVRPIEPMH